MQANPFSEQVKSNYCKKVRADIRQMKVGDSKKVDLDGKSKVTYRMSLRYVSHKANKSFETRSDEAGNLWIKRVA